MPRFLHQISYTTEAVAQLIAHPQDRFEVVRAPIEKLGGKVEHGYLAFAAGGTVSKCNTTTLLTAAEAQDAMRKAATCGYKPITKTATAANR